MEIVLYIAGAIALLALAYFLLRAAKTLGEVSIVLQHTESLLDDVRKNADQMTQEIATIRMHVVPVIDSVGEITTRVSQVAEGLQPRVDRIYETVDDALDIAEGVLEDVERIKTEVVDTIESPLKVVRNTSTGLASTIVKGFSLVKDLVQEFKKK
ncbi:MAG: hypothetical protein JSS75_08140 [Bacteroidetes bacterium]|nr:hypothetical protein [Bacteroidota bacterium]